MSGGGFQRDYLAEALLPHVWSNLYVCRTDPGVLNPENAERGHRLHSNCSSDCRMRARVDQCRSRLAEQGPEQTE
ncbi:hypothetical protein [Nocardia veterana]|uniref:Uncharacterized protein n=1 Tax=Nocardia veterana TaxID=132249 RepID=A0A7X6M0J8_9NOCA|nr:hypothetical protein [Nocardia veterana]NKY87524.1 hypothetical protein [Nocardia veterana]